MIYEYWFARMKNISDNKKKKLREAYGSAKEIYYIEETQLRLQNFLTKKDIEQLKIAGKQKDLEEKYYNMEEKGIDFVPYFQKTYPKRLSELDGAPYALYVKGKLPEEDRPSVAIIGARRCSNYGEGQALEYGKCLASAGVQIISGLALGIDGAGQRGALNGGGTTYGVLGCGVDICYPRENIGLYMDIQREGGIISEQIPGEPPMSYHFPLRNRIISGLADVVLVMEAKEKSGSLITADQALEQGKDVYVVPGRITDELSRGCLNLLKQGAGLADSPETLLEALHVTKNGRCKNSKNGKVLLAKDENIVYSWIRLQPVSLDELVKKTGFPATKVLQTLVLLQLGGHIREIRKNEYVRTDSRIIDGEVFSNRGVTGKGEDN